MRLAAKVGDCFAQGRVSLLPALLDAAVAERIGDAVHRVVGWEGASGWAAHDLLNHPLRPADALPEEAFLNLAALAAAAWRELLAARPDGIERAARLKTGMSVCENALLAVVVADTAAGRASTLRLRSGHPHAACTDAPGLRVATPSMRGMIRRMKTLLLPIAFALALVAARAAAPAGMAADFAWFGRLGFRDVKELKFVRYFQGWTSYGNGRREEMWSNGFLLDDTPRGFRVLTLQFETLEFQKEKQTADTNYRHEPADLRAFAEAALRPVDPQANWFDRHRLIAGPHFTERTRLFVLGWMCARQGLDDLAARLHASAQTSEGLGQREGRDTSKDEKDWPFRHKLERDIGDFEMWRTVVAFGDPRIARRELLARLRALPERFPHCDHLARAGSLAKRLGQMIAEDGAHPARTAGDIERLPPAAQAKEWIFRLRDQNGFQMGQPGWVDIFMTADGREDSPAHRLVTLGDAAAPALIAALGDSRLTRSVGYGRDFVFSHEVVTVGEAALTILQRIAGREFSRDGEPVRARAAVQAWWDKRQSKGAMGELAETTARGGFSSARAGAKLLAEFPNDAATPILAGAASAERDEERCEFIRLVGKIAGRSRAGISAPRSARGSASRPARRGGVAAREARAARRHPAAGGVVAALGTVVRGSIRTRETDQRARDERFAGRHPRACRRAARARHRGAPPCARSDRTRAKVFDEVWR